jgi:hypothetical protein
MLGLAIGLGAVGFLIWRRRRRGGGCGGPGFRRGWRGRHNRDGYHDYGYWYGGGGGGRDWWLGHVSRELDTTPAQERVIQREVHAVIDKARDARRGLRDGRGDLSRAVSGPEFDDGAAAAAFVPAEHAIGEVRGAAIDALRKIHEILDDEQRKRLGELVLGERFRGGPFGGPYRV